MSAPVTQIDTLTKPQGPTFKAPSGKRKFAHGFAWFLITAAMVLALIPLVWVIYDVVARGIGEIIRPDWWLYSQKGVLISDNEGGAKHAMIGTFTQVLFCAVFSIPVGVLTAVYLVEYDKGGRLGKMTTFMVDILSGVPSIVASLFIYSMWIVLFGFERSGFAVALALVLLMIPVVVRTTEEMLRVVPQDLREASYALGVPKWKTILLIVLPTAWSGIVTGIMIAIARVMGESAPVLILVGTTSQVNWNPLNGNQSSLPLLMLEMYTAGGVDAAASKMWGAALTLVVLIAVLTIGARILSHRVTGKQK